MEESQEFLKGRASAFNEMMDTVGRLRKEKRDEINEYESYSRATKKGVEKREAQIDTLFHLHLVVCAKIKLVLRKIK